MTVDERRKERLKQFYRAYTYDISNYISQTKDKRWLEIALEEKMFDLIEWKENGNINGFYSFNTLINKYYKDIGNNCLLITVLKNYLIYDYQISFSLIIQLIEVYVHFGLLKELIYSYLEKMNDHLSENYHLFFRTFFIIIKHFVINNDNVMDISKLYIKSILLGNEFREVLTCKDEFLKIKNVTVAVFMDRLNLLYEYDCLEKNDVFKDVDKDFLCFNNSDIQLIEYNKKYDYLYSDVDQWIKYSYEKNRFYRRNVLTKMLDEYFLFNKNINYIIDLLNTGSIYYTKVALHYLNKYFDEKEVVMILNHYLNYEQVLDNFSTSNVTCMLLNKYFDSLSLDKKEKIKSILARLENKNYEENITLIRSFNFLKKYYFNLNIELPSEYNKLLPCEGIITSKTGWVKEISFISDIDILNNFEDSVIKLNDIYENPRKEYNEDFTERNYRGTLNRILDIGKQNNFRLSYELLEKLNNIVLADVVDLIDYTSNIMDVVVLCFKRLDSISSINSDEFINEQLELIRAIRKIVLDDKCKQKIDTKIIFDYLLNVKDNLILSSLNTYNSYSNGESYTDILNVFINSTTYNVVSIMIHISSKNKYEEIIKHLIENNSLLCIAALAYYFDVLIDQIKEISLENVLSDDLKKEVFFAIYVSKLRINEKSALILLPLFKEFSFEKDLVCKDKRVYESVGQLIYLVYYYTNLYDSFVNELYSQYMKRPNKKLQKIIYYMLWNACNLSYSAKIITLLTKTHECISISMFDSELLSISLNLLAHIEVNADTICLIERMVSLSKNSRIDYDLYILCTHLVEDNSEIFLVEKKQIVKNILKVLKECDSYYIEDVMELIKKYHYKSC